MSDPIVTVTLGRGKVARKRLSRPPTAAAGSSSSLSMGRMYADQVEENEWSVKNRLGTRTQIQQVANVPSRSLTKILSKRNRSEIERWEHDMYPFGNNLTQSMASPDLRSKLNRKKVNPSRRNSTSSALALVRTEPNPLIHFPSASVDLRDKLSSQKNVLSAKQSHQNNQAVQKNNNNNNNKNKNKNKNFATAPTPAAAAVVVSSRPSKQARIAHNNAVSALPHPPSTSSNPNPSSVAPKAKKTHTLSSFLESLDLAKYIALFLREEIDFPTLQNFKDEDLKELNIPMGPRKKILFALAS